MTKSAEEREVIKEYNRKDAIFKIRQAILLLNQAVDLVLDPGIDRNAPKNKPGYITIPPGQE